MKKNINAKVITIILGALLVLYALAKATGVLVPYTIPTSANEPNLKVKSMIWTSNLKTPQKFDFVCFKDAHHYLKTVGIYTFRLCGLAGDKIEIRDGVLLVNDQNVDKNLTLKHTYIMPIYPVMQLLESGDIPTEDYYQIGTDSARVFLSEALIKAKHLAAKRVILAKNEANPAIKDVFHQDWNVDNFGPVIVPKDHYFLLGDNRENADDSRFWGFIAQDKVVSTVLF
jgi:signal peptidase I